MILLTNATILDVDRAELVPGQSVLVEGRTIMEVGAASEVRAADPERVIDVGGHTLMPGLIDAHVHVYFQSFDLPRLMSWMPSYLVAKAVKAMGEMLQRGFTTVRDTGGADFALAQAVEDGLIDGPRLIYGGLALSQTGGHGDGRGPGDGGGVGCSRCPSIARVADGPDGIRVAARDVLRTGAHHLKLMLSGGVASPTDSITSRQYSDEEIAVAVREAEAAGRYVTGHTYLADAINDALRLGLRCIEHGNLLDESSIRAFNDHDAFLVPTLVTYDLMDRFGLQMGLSKSSHAKNSQMLQSGLAALELADSGGVNLVYGSDLIGEQQAHQLDEFVIRAQVQSPAAILRSATTTAARLMGMGDRIGIIAPGALADLLVVNGDPLIDIAVLANPERNLRLVMKDGIVYRDRM